MINKKRSGFTLIELLIVIVILSLMAVVTIVILNEARARARDSRRLSDIKQLSKTIEMEDAANPGPLTGCVGGGTDQDVRNCTGPGDIKQFKTRNFTDPLNSSTICAAGVTQSCQYGIRNAAGTGNPLTNNYEICFFLETPVTGIPNGAGLKRVVTDGTYADDCIGSY